MDTAKETGGSLATTCQQPLFDTQQKDMIALLRVVSALWVFSVHTYGFIVYGWFIPFAKYGQDGLFFFCILSGLLIMKSYVSRVSLKDYWRKRLSRIIPIYYFWLIIVIIFRFDWVTADPFAILRSIFMLQFLAPPTVDFGYCNMYMVGILTIFMMFYIAIPFISRWVNSLEASFIVFFLTMPFCKAVTKLFTVLYGSFCDPKTLNLMIIYQLTLVPYFVAGIMIYFGLKENRRWQLMVYCLIIFVTANSYDFVGNYIKISYVVIIVAGLLCVPIKLEKFSKVLKILNRYTMGLFITHPLLQYFVIEIGKKFAISGLVQFIILAVSSSMAAVFLYHFVEVPGAKLINRLMTSKKSKEPV